MSNTPSLLPCPFCGSANVKTHVYKGDAPDAFVQCHDCSSSGPSGESDTGAIEAWNRRTPQPVVREPLTDEWIRSMCKESWVFETAKQWVRIAEAAHGITQKGGD